MADLLKKNQENYRSVMGAKLNIASLFRCNTIEPLLVNADDEVHEESWNSAEFFRDVASISHALFAAGIASGERVLILTGNRAETYAFSLAVWNLGGVAVPVNPLAGNDLVVDIISAMKPVACFHEGNLSPKLKTILSQYCRVFVVIDGSTEHQGPEVISYTSTSMLANSAPIVFGDFPADHPALIIHTSGSQGRPKVIQLSHQNLFNYFHYHDLVHRQFADSQAIGVPQKPFISVFHPSHLAAYSIALQSFLMRRPTYLLSRFIPRTYLTLLSQLGCRLTLLVPSMYVALLKEVDRVSECDFSALEICGSVGEPTPEALVQRIEKRFGVTVFAGYGLTECLPGIAHSWEDLQNKSIGRGSAGKLLFEEAKLIDEHGNESNSGELWLRNPTVHRCYLDESLNAAKFTADGWLRTGDLFYRDATGSFFHQGRIDEMFVCNGKNIYPAEIEFVLIKHPVVERAVAAPIVDKNGRIVPGVLIQTQVPVTEKAVLDFFLETGPLHAIPGFICAIGVLPELGPGKVDRKASKALLQASYDRH